MRLCALSAGLLSEDADSRGMVTGHLWLSWDTNGGARMVMGPQPDRGAAAEQFSFGAQMAGMYYDLSVKAPLQPETLYKDRMGRQGGPQACCMCDRWVIKGEDACTHITMRTMIGR